MTVAGGSRTGLNIVSSRSRSIENARGLAAAYDIPALLVKRPEDVVAALEKAINTPGPFLIDFRVKEEVNVYPMVPPGAAVDELIRRPKPSVVQGYSGVEPSW